MRSWLFILAAASAVVAMSRPPAPLAPSSQTSGPLLPRAEVVRTLGAFHPQLFADYYWLSAIQQIGLAQTRYEYRDVAAYAELATDLDPHFLAVYRIAGVAIPFNLGREVWVNTDESTAILKKGHDVAPDDLQIGIALAYNYSFFHKQYELAARMVSALAKLPRAPAYLPKLATRLFSTAGQFDDAVVLAQAMAATSADPAEKEAFELRVRELQQERLLAGVETAWRAFRQREGRAPAGIEELLSRGDLETRPLDPLGGAIELDDQGRATSTASARRLKVFLPYVMRDEEPK